MLGWIATTLTLVSVWGLGSARPRAFLLALLGNAVWAVAYWGDWPIVAVNAVMALVNLRGYFKWLRMNRIAAIILTEARR